MEVKSDKIKFVKILSYILAVVALLIVSFFAFLYRIDANPLFIWDEARVAVSALEMSQSHNYFIPTYEGAPDMWSVKPPLMIILQSVSMKLFGYSELGARMPTVLAAFATIYFLFWFAVKILKNFIAAFCAVLFLCTSTGYVCAHVARAGDYDTLLIFFLTAYFIFAITYLFTKKYRFYILFNVFLLFALLTKGIAGIFFLPGIFLLFVSEKNFFKEYFNVRTLLPPLIVFTCFVSYYLIREVYNPRYIHTVVFEEMQGRMFDSRFDTNSKWYSFFESMTVSDFNPWCIFVPLSILVYGISTQIEKRLIVGIWLTLIVFWIPLTISINKNSWYIAPSFPLLSLLSAFTFSKICLLVTREIKSKSISIAIVSVIIILISIFPVMKIIDNSYELNERFGFAELVKSKRIQSGTKIISEGYNSPIVFYQKALKLRGVNVKVTSMHNIKEGDTVIAISANEVNEVKQHFQCDVLYACKETEMLFLKPKA